MARALTLEATSLDSSRVQKGQEMVICYQLLKLNIVPGIRPGEGAIPGSRSSVPFFNSD